MIKPHMVTTKTQDVFRVILGLMMVAAALGHLTFLRSEFHAQVPDWVPFTKDFVVIASGLVELVFGLAMLTAIRYKVWVGIALAIFFVAVFPGNVHQYLEGTDAFGLNTDSARFLRLFAQPLLIVWALWSTGALTALNIKAQQPVHG